MASTSRESSQSSAEPLPDNGDGDGKSLSDPQMTSSRVGAAINTPALSDNSDDTLAFVKDSGSNSGEYGGLSEPHSSDTTGETPTEEDSTVDGFRGTTTSAQRSRETSSYKSGAQTSTQIDNDIQHEDNSGSSSDNLRQTWSTDSEASDRKTSPGVIHSTHESSSMGPSDSDTAISHAAYTSAETNRDTTIHDPPRLPSIPTDGEASSQDTAIVGGDTSSSGASTVINGQTYPTNAATVIPSDPTSTPGHTFVIDGKTASIAPKSSGNDATSEINLQTNAIAKLIMYGIGVATTTSPSAGNDSIGSTSRSNASSRPEGSVGVSSGDAVRVLAGSAFGLIGLSTLAVWL